MGVFWTLIGLDFYLGQTKFLFLLNQQLWGFQFCFPFPGTNFWASLVNFSRLSLGEHFCGPWQRHGCSFFWVQCSCRNISEECPGTGKITKVGVEVWHLIIRLFEGKNHFKFYLSWKYGSLAVSIAFQSHKLLQRNSSCPYGYGSLAKCRPEWEHTVQPVGMR